MNKLFMSCCHRNLFFKTNAFSAYILYFLFLSCVGFGVLKALKPRSDEFTPRNIDFFYTSVSAATVSSMSAVEMEAFSNAQLVAMTFLMFVGGEIFVSMIRVMLKAFKMTRKLGVEGGDKPLVTTRHQASHTFDQMELSVVKVPDEAASHSHHDIDNESFKYGPIRFLGLVVLGYLLVVQMIGIASVMVYLGLVSGAGNVLRNKGIKRFTFAVFTVVSTFGSCGFVPTNENMVVFKEYSGLLLILIPQVLLGNTLFPAALRGVLWIARRNNMAKYVLRSSAREIGCMHLLPGLHCVLLVATVLGFILIGFVFFSSIEWNNAGLNGLNTYQKVVGILFQCANARHAGETIVDLSTIAPAILVFFVLLMLVSPPLSLSLSYIYVYTLNYSYG